ncbi:Glyoxalase-like domain protein [Oceanobacillus picturae]|uniref:Glyoxalase-like domain protein n=2 Tax=Oceanobacillus picturae TaxID=171693 RepID=W9ADT8_9BACI|nr:Glyoxalase-like domain protein [Oceanobacillus picturae]
MMSKSFIEQVHYIRIPVRDLNQSSHWYRDVLGLQLLSITEDPYAIIKVNEGPFLLILVPSEDETFAHFTIENEPVFSIGFTSPDLSGFHQHLIDHGVKVEDIVEDNGHAYFHFFDPNDNKLQVHW